MSETFLTIKNCAKTGILPEHTLRLMRAQGKLPGIQSGNRFLINVPLLRQQLDEASRAAVKDYELDTLRGA